VHLNTLSIVRDLLHWFRRLRHNDTQVVFALGTGAVEVFGHLMTVAYFDGLSLDQAAAKLVRRLSITPRTPSDVCDSGPLNL